MQHPYHSASPGGTGARQRVRNRHGDNGARQWSTHMNILIVLTSHDQLGNTGRPTGFWLEEFAAPYYVFKDAGAEITLAAMIDVLGHVTLSRCEQLNIQRRDHDRNQAGEPTLMSVCKGFGQSSSPPVLAGVFGVMTSSCTGWVTGP